MLVVNVSFLPRPSFDGLETLFFVVVDLESIAPPFWHIVAEKELRRILRHSGAIYDLKRQEDVLPFVF